MFLPVSLCQKEREPPTSLSSSERALFDCMSTCLRTVHDSRFVWYYDSNNGWWSVGYEMGKFRSRNGNVSVICRILDSEEHQTIYLVKRTSVQNINTIPSSTFTKTDLFRNFRYLVYACGAEARKSCNDDYASVRKEESVNVIEVKKYYWQNLKQLGIESPDLDEIQVFDTRNIRMGVSDLAHEIGFLKGHASQLREELRDVERLYEEMKEKDAALIDEHKELTKKHERVLSDFNHLKDGMNANRNLAGIQRSEKQFKERLQRLRDENQALRDKNGQLREKIATIVGNSSGVTYVESKMWDCAKILKKLVSLRKQEHEKAVIFLDDAVPNQSDETYYRILWEAFRFVDKFYKRKFNHIFDSLCMGNMHLYSIFMGQIRENFESLLDLDKLEAEGQENLEIDFERNDPLWEFMEASARLCWAVLLQNSPKISFYPAEDDPQMDPNEFVELDADKHILHPMCRVKHNPSKIIRVTQFILPGLVNKVTLESISSVALPYVFTIQEDRPVMESKDDMSGRDDTEGDQTVESQDTEKSALEITKERFCSIQSELEGLVNQNTVQAGSRARMLVGEANIDHDKFSIQFNCQTCAKYYGTFDECVKYLIECRYCGGRTVHVADILEIGRRSV